MQWIAETLNWLSLLANIIVFVRKVPGVVRFFSGHGRFYDPLRCVFAYWLADHLWYQINAFVHPHVRDPADLLNRGAATFFAIIGAYLIDIIVRGYERTDDAAKS